MYKERNIRGYKEFLADLITKSYYDCFLGDFEKEAVHEWLMFGPLEEDSISSELYKKLLDILDEMMSPGIRVWEHYEEKLKALFKDYIENYCSEKLYASL